MSLPPQDASQRTREICARAPIVPVLVIHDIAHARPLAEALVAGGLPALEVTLWTPAALVAIREMAQVPGGAVGAGTLLTPDDVHAAVEAGATFGVSPGATEALIAACEEEDLPLLPGAATASEAMRLLERGYDMLKFFPAEAAGGIKMLKAIGGPYGDVKFIPTGGISPNNLQDYLAVPSVLACGGSWLVAKTLITNGEFEKITQLALEAVALVEEVRK